MSMDADRANLKYSKRKPFWRHFIHHRCHMHWPGCEPKPPL